MKQQSAHPREEARPATPLARPLPSSLIGLRVRREEAPTTRRKNKERGKEERNKGRKKERKKERKLRREE